MNGRPYHPLQLGWNYLRYYLQAGNGKGHGIHSPFVYAFIRNVLNDRHNYYSYGQIETLRGNLLHDKSIIPVTDLGAGSAAQQGTERKLADIAKHAAKPARLAQLLFRSVQYFHPSTIIELGTSLGISAAYLAAGNTNAKLYTLEGAPAIAKKATENLQLLGLHNTEVLTGNFDDLLQPLLHKVGTFDLAYLDGNHRYEATMRYFNILLNHRHEGTVIILDDIHWSPGMEQAWKDICNHPAVTCTIDLFFLGYVFFRPEFKVKQHFTIRH